MPLPALLPIFMGIGLAASVAGTVVQMSAAQKAAAHQKRIIELEQAAEEQRRKAMEAEARRRKMEILREQQRARSMALSNATNQGAQFSSALPGAYGQISGQTGVNTLAVEQNLEIGRNIFGINAGISQQRIGMADAQSQAAFGSGISSLGGTVMNLMPQMTSLGGSIRGGSSFTSPFSFLNSTQRTSSAVFDPTRVGSLY